jgi:MYXO-CTERM domain-containing protein
MPRFGLASLCLAGAFLLPRVASATKSSELYTSSPYGYGRYETRLRFAAGDGVVSAFFLWKDGSEVAGTFWNELDYEKIDADCKLATNALYGNPAENHTTRPTLSADFCSGFHVYSYEWTADYIAWFFDGTEIRRETGATAAAFANNASAGMQIHFNIWPGDSTFGGTLNPSILPVHQYVDWVQFSSYADGAFTLAWREDFGAATLPTGWLTGDWGSPKALSTHDPLNVNFLSGCAVLSMTADDATGSTGAMPDAIGCTGEITGSGGMPGSAGMSGSAGAAGTPAQGGMAGTAAGASAGGASGGAADPGGSGGANASGMTGIGGAGAPNATAGTGALAAGASAGSSSGGTTAAGGSTGGSTTVGGSSMGGSATGAGGSTGGSSTVGGSSTGGSAPSGGAAPAAGQGVKDDAGGCGCRVPGSTGSSQRREVVGAALVLALAGVFRRRRASRASRVRG